MESFKYWILYGDPSDINRLKRILTIVTFKDAVRTAHNDKLRWIYFAYFHSVASYGIILWRNSSYSRKIFTLQKRIIRIMMGAHPRTSCRELLKKLEILTIPSPYIYIYIYIYILIDEFLNWKSG